MLYAFVHPFLFFVSNKITKCYHKSSLVVNIINHTLLSCYATLVYLEVESKYDIDVYNFSNPRVILCGDWLLIYFIYDLIVMHFFTGINSLVYIVHHVIAIMLIKALSMSGFYHYYLPIICMFEISSIPLNIRYLLRRNFVPKNSWKMITTKALFIITFIYVRIIFGGQHVYDIAVQLGIVNNWFDGFIIICIIIFSIMHIVWLIGILLKIYKWKF